MHNRVYSYFVYKHLCSLGKTFMQASKSSRVRTLSSKQMSKPMDRNPTNVEAQHTSQSTDSARYVDFSALIKYNTLAPRVFIAPLQLDSNLLVALEGAPMVPLTCLMHHFLCTHHRPTSCCCKKVAKIGIWVKICLNKKRKERNASPLKTSSFLFSFLQNLFIFFFFLRSVSYLFAFFPILAFFKPFKSRLMQSPS